MLAIGSISGRIAANSLRKKEFFGSSAASFSKSRAAFRKSPLILASFFNEIFLCRAVFIQAAVHEIIGKRSAARAFKFLRIMDYSAARRARGDKTPRQNRDGFRQLSSDCFLKEIIELIRRQR